MLTPAKSSTGNKSLRLFSSVLVWYVFRIDTDDVLEDGQVGGGGEAVALVPVGQTGLGHTVQVRVYPYPSSTTPYGAAGVKAARNAGPPAPHPGDLNQVDHMLPHVFRGKPHP